jgi:hypothetical protein
VAQRVDLDDELHRQTVDLAQLDEPVEDRLPLPVAGKVVVSDEEVAHALGEIGAYNVLDIVGVAITRLAALDVDDRAERALERAAAPGVEAGAGAGRARQPIARQERRDRAFQVRQVVHIIVERPQRATIGVAQHLIEPSVLRLAGENGYAQILGLADVGRQLRQHGEAAGDVKATDADLDARRAQRARDIHRPRKLVRLDADQADQAATAVVAYLPNDLARIDPRVGFIIGARSELDIFTQNLAGGRVGGKPVERRQRVGRHDRTEPLDDVPVVVVMRRLDDEEVKYPRFGPRPAMRTRSANLFSYLRHARWGHFEWHRAVGKAPGETGK